MTLLATAVLAAAVAGPACTIHLPIPPELIHLAQLEATAAQAESVDRAATLLRQGRIPEARALLLPAAEAEPVVARTRAASLLAIAHAGQGEPKAAAEWARRTLARAPELPPRACAESALNAAVALAETGDAATTRQALALAERAAVSAQDATLLATTLTNRTVLEARVGGAVEPAARRAIAEARRLPGADLRASLLVSNALALQPQERVRAGAAEQLAAEALAEAYRAAAEARNTRRMGHALGLTGELHLRTGDAKVARDVLKRAVALAQASQDDPWRFRWTWLLGLAQRELGESAALETLDEAVRLLEVEKARRSFASFASMTLARDYNRVYRDLADALLVGGTRSAAGVTQAQLARVRDVLELSRTAEIEDFFRDPCIARREGERSAVHPEVAVLYPIPFADRTEILVAHASGLARFSSPHKMVEVSREVWRLRKALDPPGSSSFMGHARKLHDWLVAPAAEHLAKLGVKTLVWVPDGALRGVPPAVLHDGKTHLIEKYAIAVTPLASMAEVRAATTPRKAALTGLSLATQGFPALPAVTRELEDLSRLLNVPILRDESFTVAALRGTMERTPVNMIHVASHGQFSSEPGETFVLTYDGRLTLPQLRSALAAGKLREEPIELLTLSACETAAGDERSALGLAGVAIGAGARSALATLWAVGDDSTAKLVAGFYRGLLEAGTSKAQALRAAQISLMRDPEFAHPTFWAPYLLIGAWQ